MNKTLLCSIFLFCAISSKIIIFDEADLSKVLKSLENKKSGNLTRKLEEADDGSPATDANEDTEEAEATEEAEEAEETSDVSVASEEESTDDATEEDDSEEESEDPVDDESLPPFIPKSCYYRGNRRPGFEVDGEIVTITPSGVQECKKPEDYVVKNEVLSTDDLSDCKGLDYTYTKDGQEVTTTLYAIRNSGTEEGLPEVHPGYFNKQSKVAKLFMYQSVYSFRSWMGEIYVLCME